MIVERFGARVNARERSNSFGGRQQLWGKSQRQALLAMIRTVEFFLGVMEAIGSMHIEEKSNRLDEKGRILVFPVQALSLILRLLDSELNSSWFKSNAFFFKKEIHDLQLFSSKFWKRDQRKLPKRGRRFLAMSLFLKNNSERILYYKLFIFMECFLGARHRPKPFACIFPLEHPSTPKLLREVKFLVKSARLGAARRDLPPACLPLQATRSTLTPYFPHELVLTALPLDWTFPHGDSANVLGL